MAADAKNHWPTGDPNVAGESLPYHNFVNIHMAAAGQVTGIGLPVIFLRLFLLPLVVCLVLQMVVAGQTLVRSASAGLIGACLIFFVGDIQLDPRVIPFPPFLGVSFNLLIASPSFLFGLVVFVPLIVEVGERISAPGRIFGAGKWLLMTLFMIGASGAKVAILPIVVVALGLYGAWTYWTERRYPRAVWQAQAIAVVVIGIVYALQYRGHSSGVSIDLTAGYDYFQRLPAVALVKDGLGEILPAFPGQSTTVALLALLLGLLGLFGAQLAGVVWVVCGRGRRLLPMHAWLAALLLAGLLALALLAAPGTINQLYFLFYGVAAGCLLSAAGLRLAWRSRPGVVDRRRIAVLAFTWLALLAVLIASPLALDLFDGPHAEAYRYALWYCGLLLALMALYVAANRFTGAARWAGTALVCTALVGVGVLGTPFNRLVPAVTDPSQASDARAGLTPGLYQALAWVRDNTPSDSVIAVNTTGLFQFDQAAFSERRVFLGGWGYSQESGDVGYAEVVSGKVNPFADRLSLNAAAFTVADPTAIEQMQDAYGVRYLMVDKVNGPPADIEGLARFGSTVFENEDATVIDLAPAA